MTSNVQLFSYRFSFFQISIQLVASIVAVTIEKLLLTQELENDVSFSHNYFEMTNWFDKNS